MTTTEQIRDLVGRWVAAELAADVTTLATLATDDFRLVGPFGFVLDKEQWLDRYRSGELSTTSMTWSDTNIRQYGDTIVAIGTQAQKATYNGSPSNGDFRITQIVVRENDRWLIAGMHLSLAAPLAPAGGP